jgi:hypothetical protein
MTREELNQFLSERPQLTPAGISKEAGKGRNALSNSLTKPGPISPKILSWLLPVLKKYGYE